VVGGVLFLMLISVPFDFGRSFYPTHWYGDGTAGHIEA
jgi:hypothetical protein